MSEDFIPEDTWDDEEPEEDVIEAGDEPVIRFEMTTSAKQEALRIDKFLMVRLVGATRNKVQQALDEGMILVNGEKVKSNYRVRPLEHIVVYDTRRPESTEIIPEELPLNIVYEDDAVMLINKPAGMVVHPACGNYSGTLVNGIAWYLQQTQVETGLPRVGLAHRIDKDTTGLIVIAKSEHAMQDLSAQFKAHTVHRRYIALVWGDLEEDEGTINVPVARNVRFRKIMDTFPDGDHGSKEAITHYKVLERFNYTTLVELRLETGRTHQIRVHMKYLGHPLFGDTTYGGDRIVKGTVFSKYKQFIDNCFSIMKRQALHAKELGFKHPVTDEFIKFDSELPDDMNEVLEKWRRYTSGTLNREPVS